MKTTLLTIGQVIDNLKQGEVAVAVVRNHNNLIGERMKKNMFGQILLSVSGYECDYSGELRIAPNGQKRWIIVDAN